MNKYEVMFIVDPELGEEAVNATIEKFKSHVETNATLDSINDWGNRKLAYLINDKSEGHYVLITMTADPNYPAELERVFKIDDGIMRFLVTRIEG